MPAPTIIQRACQIADSGKYTLIDELERTLVAEGYNSVHLHLAGSWTRKQLRARMRAARLATLP